jgi:hypothetical protein
MISGACIFAKLFIVLIYKISVNYEEYCNYLRFIDR